MIIGSAAARDGIAEGLGETAPWNGSGTSPESACEHCHRSTAVTSEVITSRVCESCARELQWGQILAELAAL